MTRRGGPVLVIAIVIAAVCIGAGMLKLFLSGVGGTAAAGDEREALRVLDSIATLEKLWRDGDADGNGVADWWTTDWSGFHRALTKNGKPAQMMNGAIASADAAPLPPGPRVAALLPPSPHAGYWFRAMAVEKGYAFVAYPAEPGKGGKRVFLTREDGKLWAHEGGEPPGAWPAEGEEAMRAAGWTLTRP
ncbi:MAG: hypothetical protein K8T20_06770 [Planctomycetes bacterium]|nr:hypothetical protein [Planctomycetota bacterium]